MFFNQFVPMNNQGKSPKQYRDSMTIFEIAFWLLVVVLILMKLTT